VKTGGGLSTRAAAKPKCNKEKKKRKKKTSDEIRWRDVNTDRIQSVHPMPRWCGVESGRGRVLVVVVVMIMAVGTIEVAVMFVVVVGVVMDAVG
jgi:hypothetical protein